MTSPLLLPSAIARQVDRSPAALAAVDRDRRLTYGQLAFDAESLADQLRALGVGPGGVVGVLLPPVVEIPVALLAAWRAGAAFLVLDWEAPSAANAEAVRRAGIEVVVTFQSLAGHCGGARALTVDPLRDPPEGVSVDVPAHSDAPALVCQTADGALLTIGHGDAARSALAMADRHSILPDDRVLYADEPGRLPWEVFAALASGAALVMEDTARATVVPLGPALAAADPAEFAAVRAVVATEPVYEGSDELLARWAERTGAEVWRSYGTRICGVEIAAARFDPARPGGEVVPNGDPEVWVLDEYGDPVPPGVAGELHLGGLGTATGFLNDPALTALRLIPDADQYGGGGDDGDGDWGVPAGTDAESSTETPAGGTARLLRTGLLVRVRGTGALEHLGAVDPVDPATAGFDRPDYVAPRTAEERIIAQAWSELLELDDIGADDNFFQLGGHSLLLTRLIERLREVTGTALELSDLYAALTVADQARLITADGRRGAPAVAPVPRDRPLPLSPGQRRLYLLHSVNPSPEWVVPLFLRVPADVEDETARCVLDLLAQRHESLRTRYTSVDGEPRQLVGDAVPISWQTLQPDAPEREAVFAQQFENTFDLGSGSLWRALSVREQDGDRWLLVTIHHIACDGWSAGVLEREFEQLCAGGAELPEVEAQYLEFAAWQKENTEDERIADSLAYWRGALAELPPLDLPADFPRPAERDARGDLVAFTIQPRLADAVRTLGRRHGATPFVVALTAFAALIARCSGQWDVPIGVPVAGRGRPEFEHTVGFFLNTVVMRCRLDASQDFAAALQEVRQTVTDGFAHQEVPFQRLVEELRPERDPSRTPLYQVAFNFTEGQTGGGMPDERHGAFLYARQAAKTDLTLYVRAEADGSLTGVLEYATALFERATIEQLADCLLTLIESVTAAPASALGRAELLTAEGRAASVERWNDTADVFEPVPVIDVIERQAAATPDAVAVRYGAGTGDSTLTYRELDEAANRIAHHLRARGVGADDTVGVLLNRGPELLPALLGTWKAGAAYIPIDPSNPAERTAHVLRDSGAKLLITESALVPEGCQDAALRLDAEGAAVAARPSTRPERRIHSGNLAYVIYTSGTTGVPKGVMISHAGLSNHLQWAARALVTTPGGAPLFSSIAFDLPATDLYAPLMAGEPVHLLPADLDLGTLGRALAANAPYSFVKLATGHLELLTHQLTDEQKAGLAEHIVVAGEALDPGLAEEWSRALGGTRLVNEYGPTENSIGSTIQPVAKRYAGSVPIGLPLPNTTAYILDAAGAPAPVGVVGELCVAGEGLARGYHAQPALTAEKFVPNPYGAAGSRLYRTGDLARRANDGSIVFLGRIDKQVKIRGYRIEPGEIENRLTSDPRVRAAAVVVRKTANGDSVLAAYVVGATDGTKLDLADVRTRLAAALPEYMIPSTFTVLDTLPLNANGKLDERALPSPAGDEVAYQPPTGPAEERIAEIWGHLLNLPRIGAEESFFELGGHSILAIRMVALVQDAFDIDIPVRAVFEFATVRRLARAVEDLIQEELEQLSDAELEELSA